MKITLVWSVFVYLLHSFRAYFYSFHIFSTRFECIFSCFDFLRRAGDIRAAKQLPNLVELSTTEGWLYMCRQKYTRKECKRCKNTLEMSGEDAKIHSFRVEKTQNYTRFECIFRFIALGDKHDVIKMQGSFFTARELDKKDITAKVKNTQRCRRSMAGSHFYELNAPFEVERRDN